ncbi:MAG: response regulator [bacterium]|nr:response regulator [bacterium]
MKKRILIVDDEASIRELYRQEFEDTGYDVDTAASPAEANRAISRAKPDLMILDIKLGEDDGLAYLREIMETYHDLAVIICSAYGSFKEDFSSWLAEAYVVKSSDMEPLLSKVHEVLAD